MTAFSNNLELSAPNLHRRDAPTVNLLNVPIFYIRERKILHLYTVTGKLVLRHGLNH